MTATADEVLAELLDDLEQICDVDPEEAAEVRRQVLEAAYRAQVRLEKIRLGVVAA